MGRESQEPRDRAKRLITSLDQLLDELPTEDQIGDETWEEMPADLEIWLYDESYMNLDVRLSDVQMGLLKAMDDCNPATNLYDEFVAEWGKGSGKDFICALAALRQIYLLMCLRKPYAYHGLALNTGFQLVNVAYTKEQATEVYLAQFKSILKGSPWFLSRVDIDKAIVRNKVSFPKEITMISTSADGDAAEGKNLFFAVMDEASAFKDSNTVKAMRRADGVKVDRAADAIYNVLRTSSTSRFPQVGKVAIISYPRYVDDFTQTKRKENAERERGWTSGPLATWEVNPTKTQADFADAYQRNPEQAAAMYECKPPYSEDGYITYPNRFIDCVIASKKLNLVPPIDSNGAYSPFFKAEPNRYYAIHNDLAFRKDRCALALARQGEPVERVKCPCNKFNWDGIEVCMGCGRPREQWIKSYLPTMVVTLLKSFAPRMNSSGTKEVDFSDVRQETMWLIDRGHRIWALSYDGWQSVDSIQTMGKILGQRTIRDRYRTKERKEDIVSTLSVDRDTVAHDTLKEFIYDGRFFIVPPEGVKTVEDWNTSMEPVCIAFREWRALRMINAKKIDHPIGGSKDFIDALAGAAYWVARMPMVRSTSPILLGWTESPVRKR